MFKLFRSIKFLILRIITSIQHFILIIFPLIIFLLITIFLLIICSITVFYLYDRYFYRNKNIYFYLLIIVFIFILLLSAFVIFILGLILYKFICLLYIYFLWVSLYLLSGPARFILFQPPLTIYVILIYFFGHKIVFILLVSFLIFLFFIYLKKRFKIVRRIF